jgi:predicted metalloprotease with PDZ domain
MPLDRVVRITTDTEADDDRRDLAYRLSRPPSERIRHVEESRRQWSGSCDSTGAPYRIDRRVWVVRDMDDPNRVLGRQTSPRR